MKDHSAWRLAATLRSVFDAVYKSYPTISDSRMAINEVLSCTLVREATLDILDEAGETWSVADEISFAVFVDQFDRILQLKLLSGNPRG